MARIVASDRAGSEADQEPLPYAPGWVNRLNDWLDRLPGSSGPYYLLLWLALFLLASIAPWVEGVVLFGTLVPALAFLAAAFAFILGLIAFLDRRAGTALSALRPALDVDSQLHQELHFRLTTLPARSTLVAGLVPLAIVFLIETAGEPYRLPQLDPYPVSTGLLRVLYLACWSIFGVLLFHTFHQLRMIHRIYTQHTRVSLFRMKPLYAFSNLAALTAACLTAIPYIFLAVNRIRLDEPQVLGQMLVIQALAVVTFVWPQLGIHRLQAGEKDRLLDEASQRFEAVAAELHRRVDAQALDKMGELNTTLATLEQELSHLKRIPTWPWQPETVRWLASALLLPLGLWIIQYVLQFFLTH